jgi:hypothetical protein
MRSTQSFAQLPLGIVEFKTPVATAVLALQKVNKAKCHSQFTIHKQLNRLPMGLRTHFILNPKSTGRQKCFVQPTYKVLLESKYLVVDLPFGDLT